MTCRVVLQRLLSRPACLCRVNHNLTIGRRTFLSPAYTCKDDWNQRLKSPLLQKVDIDDLAGKLQEKFDKEGLVAAVDIDILANRLDVLHSDQIDFIKRLFYRFRHTKEAVHVLDSTPYALIRSFLENGETERLIEILQDKPNYGIFLDSYTANMLLDHFIKEGSYKDAASVAIDLMFQEDFSHPVTRYLSWYTCLKYYPTIPEPEATEAKEDEEELLVRVDYIMNEWYDDHFDIPKESQRVGKALVLVSSGEDNILGRSSHLIGLGLYEKMERGIEFIKENMKKEGDLFSIESIDSFRKSLENLETKEVPETEKERGTITLEDVIPYYTAEKKEQLMTQFEEVVKELQGKNGMKEVNIEEMLKKKVEEAVKEKEESDIKEQIELFKEWGAKRQELVEKQIKEFLEKQKRESIVKRLKELQVQEEKLSYFEQQEKVALGITRIPKIKPIEEVVEEEQFVAAPGERGKMV